MPKGYSYYDVLTAALEDIVSNGFDSAERVAFWSKKLRESAERAMGTQAKAEQALRDGLTAMYKKLIDNGQIAKYHPGISRFTLEKVRPHLRAELDRRIMASANLITLNRETSIDNTIRRFVGWATSIPAGGTKTQNKAKQRENIKKPLKNLPFETRRVLIDQGHKLNASLSEILAKDGKAIAGYWHSNWRQPGYDYREDHKHRDQKCYALRGNWALERGLMKAGPNGFYDKITAVGEEPFCRCKMRWVYNLRDLPPDMITAKGMNELRDARVKLAS